ncbi:MAG: two-component system, response regulator PdtaR [Bradyrhizobium sp.]|nr:two-component system, response regulator PdtaR [Bradyrhizobium sp.]
MTSAPFVERVAMTPAPGPCDRPDAPPAGERPDRQGPARILVVEDDFLIAMQTEAALAAAGFHVVGTAATAEQALELAEKERPVLAVMDIRLASKRDGIDAARELYHELNIRCIFATAHDDETTRKRAAPYAPLGWLAKPYSTASLVALVTSAIGKRE